MGVIYLVKDDVRDLLIPFIKGKGGLEDGPKIEALYRSASLGEITTTHFWTSVNLGPEVEDEYLEGHRLTTGVLDFLERAESRGQPVWCLSNDVSEWSRKLRVRFGLDRYLADFLISGDVGFRKPNPAIFTLLVERLKEIPGDIAFVDDNIRNLDSAATLGIQTVLFNPENQDTAGKKHKTAVDFAELDSLIT
jgi:HAD superfamily hydrolase (TIGR01509 family)